MLVHDGPVPHFPIDSYCNPIFSNRVRSLDTGSKTGKKTRKKTGNKPEKKTPPVRHQSYFLIYVITAKVHYEQMRQKRNLNGAPQRLPHGSDASLES